MTDHYDNPDVFDAYAGMARSQEGLAAAGEWYLMGPLIPLVAGKAVLDLGCGYGWHCRYLAEQGAREVLGIDSSQRMIDKALSFGGPPSLRYERLGILDYHYPPACYDLVMSNLALHYVVDLARVYALVHRTLKPGGVFLFNIEHPIFTASPGQDWVYDSAGQALHWPVDDYFRPGARQTRFLGQAVTKQHHSLSQIVQGLLEMGFSLMALQEVIPAPDTWQQPGMADELRRPMMLIIKAVKQP